MVKQDKNPKSAGIIRNNLPKGAPKFPEGSRGSGMKARQGLSELFDEEMAKRGPKPRSPADGVPEQPKPPAPNAKMRAAPEPAPAEPAPAADLSPVDVESLADKYAYQDPSLPMPEAPQGSPKGPGMPTIPPVVGIPGMVAAGMMIPRTTGGAEDEAVIRKIMDQQRMLGGGPRNEHDMNALIASAMGGSAAPDQELYDAIVPGGAGDGNLGIAKAGQGAPDISEEELRRMILESQGPARRAAMGQQAPDPNTPGYGDRNGAFGRPVIQQPAEDVMTRLMMEQLRNGK